MSESIVISIFCLAMVFFVLFILYVFLIAISKILRINFRKTSKIDITSKDNDENWDLDIVQASSGELRLVNVDEKTAAMIMAIVSDESQIPLSELSFKSIKAID